MGAPSKYRVIFYAEQLNGSSWKTDFTNWINIPRPEIVVSTTPSSVDLLPGENKTIELQVKSSADFDSDIDISAMQNPDVQTKFMNKRLHVPSDGIAAMPVQIKVSEDALPRQYTIPIIMNSSVPVESFVKPNYADAIDKTSVVPSFIDSEVITKQTSLTITVLEPMNQIDKFLESMKKLEFIITFSFGIVSGHIGPWIFAWVKKKKSRSTTNTENDNIIQAGSWES